ALFLFVLPSFSASAAATKPRNAILLSNVESLTLRGDRQTSHRRVPAVPQLTCISSPAVCGKHAIDLMRCENKGAGYDTEDIQWSCTAQLPPELKLGSTDVICEGYDGPDDPYILKGSCAVEYRLALTREGEERWPDLDGGPDDPSSSYPSNDSFAARWFPSLFWLIFFSVVGFIIYSAWKERNAQRDGGGRANHRRAPRRNTGGGWAGGGDDNGGDDGWDDPPPPYPGTQRDAGGPYKKQSSSSSSRTTRNSGAGSNWQSNLLSGAAGAAAGYYAGSRGNNSSSNNGQNYGSMRGAPSRSSWGSNPSSSPGGSSSGSSASASRYESTGFGSTSRR
ncbi:hypothetical protein BD289DRAFT_343587, partial [Coniella lustricola]